MHLQNICYFVQATIYDNKQLFVYFFIRCGSQEPRKLVKYSTCMETLTFCDHTSMWSHILSEKGKGLCISTSAQTSICSNMVLSSINRTPNVSPIDILSRKPQANGANIWSVANGGETNARQMRVNFASKFWGGWVENCCKWNFIHCQTSIISHLSRQ